MDFSFEKVYDDFAKPLDGKQLDSPFGPFLIMVDDPMSDRPRGALVPQLVVLSLMVQQDGNNKIDTMISNFIRKNDDDFCVALIHEGHVKKMEDPTPEQESELKKRGLSKDPGAQHVAMIRIFHKSGNAAGFCPMDAERRATYVPLEPIESLVHVNTDADQNYPQ